MASIERPPVSPPLQIRRQLTDTHLHLKLQESEFSEASTLLPGASSKSPSSSSGSSVSRSLGNLAKGGIVALKRVVVGEKKSHERRNSETWLQKDEVAKASAAAHGYRVRRVATHGIPVRFQTLKQLIDTEKERRKEAASHASSSKQPQQQRRGSKSQQPEDEPVSDFEAAAAGLGVGLRPGKGPRASLLGQPSLVHRDSKEKAELPHKPSRWQQLFKKKEERRREGRRDSIEGTMDGILLMDEHTVAPFELVERYGLQNAVTLSDPRRSAGLTSEQAQKLLEVNGPNVLAPPKRRPELLVYLSHFANVFMMLLEVAGALCFACYFADPTERSNLIVGCVLWAITVFSCTATYLQERQAANLMASFTKLLPLTQHVRRNGQDLKVDATNLVVGDVCVVKMGDKVPADMRLLSCTGLKLDNSALTGEAEPQGRAVTSSEENPLEAENLLWSGTLVVEGEGVGLVVRTGKATLIASIGNLAAEQEGKETTLQLELRVLVFRIACIAFTMGIAFTILDAATTDQSWAEIILTAIAVIMANAPEGLPPAVTACLSIAAQRLAGRSVYVKKLESLETMGNVSVIASDKTGTLTLNKMTATHCFVDGKVVDAADVGRHAASAPHMRTPEFASARLLLDVGSLCNRADFDRGSGASYHTFGGAAAGQPAIIGDASETALLRWCESHFSVSAHRVAHPKLLELPFNSRYKLQASLHQYAYDPASLADSAGPSVPNTARGSPPVMLLVKGAPERILDMCTRYTKEGRVYEMAANRAFREATEHAMASLAQKGGRCMAFAYQNLSASTTAQAKSLMAEMSGPRLEAFMISDKDKAARELVFVGLVCLMDPPRPDVPDAVKQCRTAGIKVVMVTGDHPFTGLSIGHSVNILGSDSLESVEFIDRDFDPETHNDFGDKKESVVIHGEALHHFTEKDWSRILSKREIVFARTSPQQKLEIVKRMQKRGEIVAVTGDGVNDAPALKQAHGGCAMGGSGSEVAKDAAALVLMDDSFSSVVTAVREGRAIFENLRKSVAYTLAHLLPEVAPVMLSVALRLPMGLSPILILIIDLGSEMAPSIALAYEDPEADIMNRPPRNAETDSLVSAQVFCWSYLQIGLMEAVCAFLCYLSVFKTSQFNLSVSDLVGTSVDHWSFTKDTPLTINGVTISPAEQVELLRKVQSSWFCAIVICQVFNALGHRTRSLSLFSVPFFGNPALLWGLLGNLLLVCNVLYVPVFNGIFNTAPIYPNEWALQLPFLFGIAILLWSEVVKYMRRNHPQSYVAKYLAW